MSELHTALAEIGKAVGYIQKDAQNRHHQYKYASAEAVLGKVRDACYEHGVVIVGSEVELVHAEGSNRVVRITQTYAKGDETATFQGLGEGKDNQDKATMKANTAAIKYLLTNAFNISWGDDPEGKDDAEDQEVKTTRRRTSSKSSKPTPSEGPDKDAVLEKIAGAESIDDLGSAMALIVKFRKDKKVYAELKEAYKARKDELNESGDTE